jgi:hypothetical protein
MLGAIHFCAFLLFSGHACKGRLMSVFAPGFLCDRLETLGIKCPPTLAAGHDRLKRLKRCVAWLAVTAIATIRVFCEGNPSLGTAVVNGLLAWAGLLGGLTVLFSGLPAAVALFIPSRPDSLARRINQGLGYGFLAGVPLGALLFFVFVARLNS